MTEKVQKVPASFFGWFSIALFAMFTQSAKADWFFRPSLGVGANSAQETYYRVGLDGGFFINENLYTGGGAFYSAGAHPDHDREIGGGPFVGYVYPLLDFLSLHAREDIDYVDQRNPILHGDGSYTHDQEDGIESSTYAGVSVKFTDNFGVSAGYRLVVGLTNSSLDDGRSGFAFGLAIGI